MSEEGTAFLVKILKTLFYTFVFAAISMIGVGGLASWAFNVNSVENSNTWSILSICVGIILSIFYCTFTIIDEIRKK